MGNRVKVMQWGIIIVAAIILGRLFALQVLDSSYKISADNNTLRHSIQYPPRGEVYDRRGEFLVQSKETYDLIAIPRDVKPFDTLLLSNILGVEPEAIRDELQKARNFSPRRASVLFKQLPKEIKLRFEEYDFPGFFTVYRTVRYYPTQLAGNFLGYIGEVDDKDIARDPYYRSGDYIGKSGIELSYEDILRGEKGVKIELVDVHGIVQGSYANGQYDTLPTPGLSITTTLDARMQKLAEELLAGKVGSVMAIIPATGEVLVMASSPTYDPDKMVGRDRSANFLQLRDDPRLPMFNRAVMAHYPPGSTFKVVQGLIAQQEGLLVPSQKYVCHGKTGYIFGNRNLGCHVHTSPLDLTTAVQTSCNAYFCYVFRNIIENNKRAGSVREAYDIWRQYVLSFGFGRKLDTDFLGELNGRIPESSMYDRWYNRSWNGNTIISNAIGQGELEATPLQVANLAVIVANRGYYYIPHIVKSIEGRDSIDSRFHERHYTLVDAKYYEPIVEGMYRAVHNDGGTARRAYVPGLEICGKTGTAQNNYADHSTFMCFAPRNNPEIAVSVYIENGGWGGVVATSIGGLLTELYLTDTITRPAMVEEIKQWKIDYPRYDRQP